MSNKRERIENLRKENDEYYKRLGWKPGRKQSPYNIPTYRSGDRTIATSDRIPGSGTKAERKAYTGDELLGIATMHKSNSVPVRKDNKKHAVDVSKMRRG